jgi:anti-anti-sigma factor
MTGEEGQRRDGLRVTTSFFEVGKLMVHSEREGDLHTIYVRGELDLATAEDLERELIKVEDTDALSIILDLSDLEFIDSTGVRVLLSAHARSRANSNRLTLLRGSAAVQRVFEVTGILNLLPFAN